jgi:hypothetical protein
VVERRLFPPQTVVGERLQKRDQVGLVGVGQAEAPIAGARLVGSGPKPVVLADQKV